MTTEPIITVILEQNLYSVRRLLKAMPERMFYDMMAEIVAEIDTMENRLLEVQKIYEKKLKKITSTPVVILRTKTDANT